MIPKKQVSFPIGLVLAVLAAIYVCPDPVFAQASDSVGIERYIAIDGSDATGTGTIDKPYATLPFAIGTLGGVSGTIYLMPGEYLMAPINLDPWSGDATAFLKIAPQGGKETVKIRTNSARSPFASISAGNVYLTDLWFVLGATNSIHIDWGSRNVKISGCVIDQTESQNHMASAILVNDMGGIRVSDINISGNAFLGVSRAAMEVTGVKADFIHFIGNTVHMKERASQGIKLNVKEFSGVVVTNNIFHYSNASYSPYVLEFRGKGRGTRVHLNCFSSAGGVASIPVSNKLATRSVRDLDLPFQDFNRTPAGGSLRGTCLDIYAQDHLGALKRSTYVK